MAAQPVNPARQVVRSLTGCARRLDPSYGGGAAGWAGTKIAGSAGYFRVKIELSNA